MTLTPGWKTTELWLAVLGVGALLWVLQTMQSDLPQMAATGPAWAVGLVPIVQGLIGLAIAALGRWYMAHRQTLKLAAGAAPTTVETLKMAGMADLRFMAFLGALVLAVACAHLTPTEQAVVTCAEGEGTRLIPQLIPLLLDKDWPEVVTAFVKGGGDAAVCALQAVANGQTTAAGAPNDAAQNARAWLSGHSVLVLHK